MNTRQKKKNKLTSVKTIDKPKKLVKGKAFQSYQKPRGSKYYEPQKSANRLLD